MDHNERNERKAEIKTTAALSGCQFGETLSEHLTHITGAIYFAHKVQLGEPANAEVLDYSATIRGNAVSHILSPLVAFFIRDALAAGKSREQADKAAVRMMRSLFEQLMPHMVELGHEYLEARAKLLERELFGDIPNPEKTNAKVAGEMKDLLSDIMVRISEANNRNGGKPE